MRVSASGSFLESFEELQVPFVLLNRGALAVHLVRQAAGSDDATVVSSGYDSMARRRARPSLNSVPAVGNRELQHAHLQRTKTSGQSGSSGQY